MRVEIRRLKELEVFNSLRLSIVVTAKALTEIAAEVLIKVTAEIAVKATTEATIELIADILSRTELKVLLIAIYYWDSLKSYISFSTQSPIEVSSYL